MPLESDPTPKILSVTEVNCAAKSLLEEAMGGLWIEGEVSNVTYARSGHLYFTLSDPEASLDAVMWRSAVQRTSFAVEHGMKLHVRGTLTVYPGRGRYQVMVDDIREAGLGDLVRAFEQLKRKLAAEGLFDEERKQPLPTFPRCVGVVTSRTGAAVADIFETIRRRAPGVPVLLSPARVQGDGAAADIRNAFNRLVEHGQADVIIVGRGGGSAEDLMAFNDEALVRTVASSPVPTVSAVGHEVDFSLTDFVADVRAKTPTEAGEFVVPDVVALGDEVRGLQHRARTATKRRVTDGRLAAADFERRLQQCHPRARIERVRADLERLESRLSTVTSTRVERHRSLVSNLSGRLDALSPLRVLDRGYAYVRRLPDGTIIREPSQVRRDEKIEVIFANGGLLATVDGPTR